MQRFRLRQGKLRPDVDGEWVRHADAADLLAACEATIAAQRDAHDPDTFDEMLDKAIDLAQAAIAKAKRTE